MDRNRRTATFRFLSVLLVLLMAGAGLWAQQTKPPAAQPPAAQPPSAQSSAPTASTDAEFLQTADAVLADMSKLLSLPVLEPLKKSIRSREQIREYLIKNMDEDKDKDKRYADQRALEAFGAIPKDYPLDQKLLALLTEQIAGLYDPKGREFFIADWTNPADQQVIMAHELTHALQDQHFHIEKWEDAVKKDDDALLARDAVLEGSATVAMIDYLLRGTGKSSREIPQLDPSLLLGDVSDSPELASAPLVIREEMLFPYFAGSSFVQTVLKAGNGWPDFHKLFENPPASTQQIMHPELYLKGVVTQPVSLAPLLKTVPHSWKKLDENGMGEFFVHVILKQFIGQQRADELAPAWAGDRYAIFEQKHGGPTLLLVRLRLDNDADAARFFGGYSQVLELKNDMRTDLLRRPNYFSFNTPSGGVFLRCMGSECLVAEGATPEMYAAMVHSLGWSPNPNASTPDGKGVVVQGPRNARPQAWMSASQPSLAGAALSAR